MSSLLSNIDIPMDRIESDGILFCENNMSSNSAEAQVSNSEPSSNQTSAILDKTITMVNKGSQALLQINSLVLASFPWHTPFLMAPMPLAQQSGEKHFGMVHCSCPC